MLSDHGDFGTGVVMIQATEAPGRRPPQLEIGFLIKFFKIIHFTKVNMSAHTALHGS